MGRWADSAWVMGRGMALPCPGCGYELALSQEERNTVGNGVKSQGPAPDRQPQLAPRPGGEEAGRGLAGTLSLLITPQPN